MIDFNAAWAWTKVHYKALLAGVGLLLGAIAMAFSRSNRVNNPLTALKVKKDAKVIAQKEAQAEILEHDAEDKHEEIAAIEIQVAESKKRVAVVMHGPIVDGMTDAEIADLYRKSGL